MSTDKRGLQNIRTMGIKPNSKLSSHKICINVATLELEKQRHTQELNSLLKRVDELKNRLQQIALEQGKLTKIFLDKSQVNKLSIKISNKNNKKISSEVKTGILKLKY